MRHNEAQERRAMDARQEQEDELQLHRVTYKKPTFRAKHTFYIHVCIELEIIG
jgi:hypothetical protein